MMTELEQWILDPTDLTFSEWQERQTSQLLLPLPPPPVPEPAPEPTPLPFTFERFGKPIIDDVRQDASVDPWLERYTIREHEYTVRERLVFPAFGSRVKWYLSLVQRTKRGA